MKYPVYLSPEYSGRLFDLPSAVIFGSWRGRTKDLFHEELGVSRREYTWKMTGFIKSPLPAYDYKHLVHIRVYSFLFGTIIVDLRDLSYLTSNGY
ncbi:hypothetical protein CGRA01v4_04465 [Colletotrichum graminicola]|nr:hypothetical protein CGRA01v4_04465 [Colletotrichum graminicola]